MESGDLGYSPPPDEGSKPSLRQGSPSSDDKEKPTHIRFLVSNTAAGSIIGKGGSTINEFQSQSGARIQLSRNHEFFPGTSDRIILISGAFSEILKAMELILEKLFNEVFCVSGASLQNQTPPVCSIISSFIRKSMMRRAIAVQAILFLQLLCFQVLSQSDGSTAPMEQKEKEALYSMIQGFVGKWWNGSGLYPDPCGWTSIQGVSCDLFDSGMWYVTAVSIGPTFDNSLQCSKDAEFSPYLFELRHLKSLSIFNCFSSSTTILPHNWDKLSSSLHTLEFRSNRGLTGEIPPSIGQLVNLQSLVFTENSLIGELPWELGNLVHMKRLTLSANQLSGPIPASLGANLPELLIMDISSNSLTGPLPSSLGGLTSLLKLDLSNNLLCGNLPQELCNLKNLTLMDFRNNTLSGGIPPSLQGMVSLQDMSLSYNPLGGNMKEFGWSNLKNLTHLDLSSIDLVGEIPDSITELKKLRFLALDNNKLSCFVTPKLATMHSLSALYLNGNNLTGELAFREEFYKRMGRRFASWNNPNLCYRSAGQGPVGVNKCNNGEESSVSGLDSGTKIGSKEAYVASLVLSAFPNPLFLWLTFLGVFLIFFLLSSI